MEIERTAYWKALFHADTDQAVSELSDESEEFSGNLAHRLGEDFFLEILQRCASDTAASLIRVLPGEIRDYLLARVPSEQ